MADLKQRIANLLPDRRAGWLFFGLIALLGLVFSLLSFLAPSVTVEWSTGSELETAGFNVYRSQEMTAGYERITEALIPAAGEALAGSQYSYVDHEVRFGGRYYYLLEDVGADGSETKFGPRLVESVGVTEGILSGILFAAGLARTTGLAGEPAPEVRAVLHLSGNLFHGADPGG
jgi:hypothetical protein